MLQDEMLGDITTILASTAGVDPAEVTPQKSFTHDLGIDSLTLLEVVVAVEDRFGVLILDDEWSRFSTVGDLMVYLEQASVVALT